METRNKNKNLSEKLNTKTTKQTNGHRAKGPWGDSGGTSLSTPPKDSSGSSADHSSVSMATELDGANEDNGSPITLHQKIQDALLSEEVISKIVHAVSTAIVENVTNEVYKAINFDSQLESEKVVALEAKVKVLENQLASYQNALEEHEQYSRRNCLRIHGIVEKPDEQTDDVVIKLIRDKLEIAIRPEDLDRSHRVPVRAQDLGDRRRPHHGREVADDLSPPPKPIIIKFARYNVRQQVYAARHNLKGTKVYIHEDLTRERSKLVYQARNHDMVKKIWTNDGRISVLTKNDKKVKIRTINDLNKL